MTETTDLAPTPPETDLTIVALSPADMAHSQTELSTWCDRKLEAVKRELNDLEVNLELATEHGWKYQSVANSINRAEKRILYYEKMKAAVEAGYLMVPNFPIDVFAVRVKRAKQRESIGSYPSSSAFDAKPELLPSGEGRYVDDRVFHVNESYMEKTPDGNTREISRYVSADYDEVDFPVAVVKPAVLQATARAMALRVFDQMGTVSNQVGRDPIVVGRLLDPRGNRRCVTFFVAWWLDTATL